MLDVGYICRGFIEHGAILQIGSKTETIEQVQSSAVSIST